MAHRPTGATTASGLVSGQLLLLAAGGLTALGFLPLAELPDRNQVAADIVEDAHRGRLVGTPFEAAWHFDQLQAGLV